MNKRYFRCVAKTTPIVVSKYTKRLKGRGLSHWVHVGVTEERKPIYRAVVNLHGAQLSRAAMRNWRG